MRNLRPSRSLLPSRSLRVAATSSGLAAMLLLSACVVVPARHVDAGYPSAGGVYAEVPPPAPQYEVVPVAPFLGAVWVAGYWGWHGGRHHWVAGRWSRPHHHGRAWVPHRWAHTPRGWHLGGGHWN